MENFEQNRRDFLQNSMLGVAGVGLGLSSPLKKISTKSSPALSTLPEGLRTPENLAKIKMAVTQWSQLVAWSWTDSLAFADEPQKAAQEQKLKRFFIDTLQTQVQNSKVANAYGQQDSMALAQSTSETFKKLLGGDQDIDSLQRQGVQLTLSDVLQKSTGRDYVFKVDPALLAMFRFEVADEFCGSIREDEEGRAKYVSIMTYPARPALSEATVTEAQLVDWMHGKGSDNYLPPSYFIPTAGT